MISSGNRAARADLDAARPAIARLDVSRGAEDVAADLIETWTAVESALRSMVGSSTLTGQQLIREARQRQLIDFDLANSLAAFLAARDRVHDTGYQPTYSDVNAARGAFLKLDATVMSDASPASNPAVGASAAAAGPTPSLPPASGEVVTTSWVPPANSSAVKTVGPPSRIPIWLIATLGVIVLAALVTGGWLIFGRRGNSALDEGIAAYKSGQREVAVSAFNRAVRDDPHAALPHVFLARMAREVGNSTLATQELTAALQAEPSNEIALREMAANLLAEGNAEFARRFYVRAVEADPSDKSAQGYLGCALMKLNRTTEAQNFLNRAGPGPWSTCEAPPPSQTPAKP